MRTRIRSEARETERQKGELLTAESLQIRTTHMTGMKPNLGSEISI